MKIHSILIEKTDIVDLPNNTVLCTLPEDSTFISMEDNGDTLAIIYSTPSETEITVDVGSKHSDFKEYCKSKSNS